MVRKCQKAPVRCHRSTIQYTCAAPGKSADSDAASQPETLSAM